MQFSILILATLFLSTFASNSSLIIISPSSLAAQFPEGEVNFALSNYGAIPHGTHLTGRLIDLHPIDACGPIAQINSGEENEIMNPIAVVERGDCRLAIKARYAQAAGARAVVIVDNQDKETLEDWLEREYGTEDITIPTLLITKNDGEKIKQFILNKERSTAGVLVSMKFFYDKSNTVQMDYWYNSADRYKTSITFLQQFYEYWQRNSQVIDFQPHIVTWTCSRCQKEGFQDKDNKDCLSGGRYCSPDPDDEGKLSGADVVRENLRQMCVYKHHPKLWWDYTIAVGQNCKDEFNECGKKILKDKATLEQYNEVIKCIEESWKGDERLAENSVLKESKQIQQEYAINQFPLLFINDKPFYGRLNHANLVFEEVCRNIDPMPEDCNIALARTGETTYNTSQVHWGRIIVLVIVMLIVAVFSIFYCRRIMKRDNKDMSLEVGGMVNRYFSVKDSA